MDEFYPLLKIYNSRADSAVLPEWTNIYNEKEPPVYWNVLKGILKHFSRSSTVFEIGSGTGDLLALIMSIGFDNVSGIEKDEYLAKVANRKINHFFNRRNRVIHGRYPIDIQSPNILLQVNCVYFDDIDTKDDYLSLLKSFHQNARPDHYLIEVIDSSYICESKTFPEFVRLSERDMREAFTGYTIEAFETYKYPFNSSTKILYLIS